MIKIFFKIFLIAGIHMTVSAQYTKSENSAIQDAEKSLAVGDYLSVWQLLEPISHVHSEDARLNYLLGDAALHLTQYKSEALKYLEKSSNSGYEPSYQSYASLLLLLDDPRSALQWIEQVPEKLKMRKTELLKLQCENAIASEVNDLPVVINWLSRSINSDFIEHTPLVSYDDSVLFYTSRRPISKSSITDLNQQFDENIFYSVRDEYGWQTAQALPGDINGALNDATVALSPGSDEMLVFKTNRNLESSDLWLAEFNANEWELKSKLKAPINSKFVENSASFNRNSNTYYISSDRPGGYGGFDLYRIVRFGNGDLSEPQNMGPEINSEYDEISPFLLPDGQTLFFSSNGINSIGGFDIFKSKRLLNEAWSEPENLGRPICTTGDDLHINVSWKGGSAYFSRARSPLTGNLDIAHANLPGFNISANVLRVKIENVIGIQNIEVTMFSDDFSETLGIYSPNENGEFIIVLLPGDIGILEILHEDFEPLEVKIEYDDEEEGIVEIPLSVELDFKDD